MSPRFRLRLFAQQFDLREGVTRIGRSDTCAITIDDSAISREHAEIVVRDGRAFLRDLGSRNGVRIDGARVYEEIELRSGDRIGVGHQDLVFTREGMSSLQPTETAQVATCLACAVPFPATELRCPLCRASTGPDETLEAAAPPSSRSGWWLALQAELLAKALDLGRLDDAQEILQTIDDGVASAILARSTVDGVALESALTGAIRAGIALEESRWIGWSLDTMRAFRHRPTGALVARLESIPRSLLGESRVALAALVADAETDLGAAHALSGLAAIAAGLSSKRRLRAATPAEGLPRAS
ncbi:MAG: hypothetical protein NVSMB47_02660 [Polyangiales bacterium]